MASPAAVPPPSAVPPPPPPAASKLSFPSKVYNGMIGAVDKHVPAKLRPLWMHPAGEKTMMLFTLSKIFEVFLI